MVNGARFRVLSLVVQGFKSLPLHNNIKTLISFQKNVKIKYTRLIAVVRNDERYYRIMDR